MSGMFLWASLAFLGIALIFVIVFVLFVVQYRRREMSDERQGE